MTVFKRPSLYIYFILATIFTIHILVLGYQMLYPELPSTKTYKKPFKDVDFPLVFRICAHELENSSAKFQKYGYGYDGFYFVGQSMYNASIFGWNGHTPNGSTIAPFEGIVKFIFSAVKAA